MIKYIYFLKYILRLLNVSFSSYLAYIAFGKFYEKFMTYLPIKTTLDLLNTQQGTGLSSLLRENSSSYREMYFHAYEKSLALSFVVFLSSLFLIEYIYRANRHKTILADKIIDDVIVEEESIAEKNSIPTSPKYPETPNYSKDFFNKNKTP